ncbi:putative Myosin heavy chain-like protein [Quillaja saponaria]|uniref:Myosin heavy chain-like protein n=1 Tax=Quillaja saponaria TaxID=32244 RepID=A0AAD7LJ67_QUISA|nr:putative Myosin heavy chain-like protein [Quillaja saponaria]KAJ7959059.1 putative Myosin heavy chain-like protein [Quillaja saponaria]
MSRITECRLEKTKVKVVFRLQFHATHIPQIGWDKLFVSFIPADSGKVTAKTTKAIVRSGTCKWADPIYETTRLLQDIKTKQYDEKFYKIVVAMGSSRSSILGEVNINLADFADASKPSAVVFPLHGCEAGPTLHVTVQLLTSKTGFREFEQQRELRERGLTTTDQRIPDESADRKFLSAEQADNNHMDKVNSRVKFKRDSKDGLSSLEEVAGMNEECGDSAAGFDGSSNTSESMYAEKHDTSSTHEVDSLKSTISGDFGGVSFKQKGDASDNQFLAHGTTTDWGHGWGSDYTSSNDLAVYEENARLRANLELAESSIVDLQLEVSSLQSQADEIGGETHKFSQQLAAEISLGDKLAKEVTVLKSECLKFKDDLAQFKNSKASFASTSGETIGTDHDNLCQKLQVKWINGLIVMEDKLRELQNKVCIGGYNGRDFEFLNLDLQQLVEVLQGLKGGTGEAISGTYLATEKEGKEIALHKCEQFVTGSMSDSELCQPESMLHCLTMHGVVSLESDSIDSTVALKGNIFELLKELDESKTEQENLARKMDQMECYYEALVQELEQNQRQMMGELQSLRNEHSTCLYTISSGKTQIEIMHQNMNEQMIKFSEDKRILDSLNNELERRAVTAEATLKRARLNYSIAVEQLQKDLELLSCQVLSVHEANKNLIKQAFSNSSLPSLEGYLETEQNQKLVSEESHTADLLQGRNQNAGVKKQNFGGNILLKDLKRSVHLQEGLYEKVEEELCEIHLVNIHVDVFSKALQETLIEAIDDIRLMKVKVNQLQQELDLSTESKELLMLRLQNAMDDIVSLNEYKATSTTMSNDIALRNQILETNFENLAHENRVLTQKINELEALMTEHRNQESSYKACSAENFELINLRKKESLENGYLHDEISFLKEELKTMRTEVEGMAFAKDNLENIVNSLYDKLHNLLVSHDTKYSKLSLWRKSTGQDLRSKDLADLVLQLEELQCGACERILLLMEEKENLMDERHTAQVSLNNTQSDLLIVKQKFERDLREMVNNLSASSALVQKLQLEFEAIVNRLKDSSDTDEIYAQHHTELLSGLDRLQADLQQLSSRNEEFAHEISALNTLSGDLATCKLEIATIADEKETLMVSLQEKTFESSRTDLELHRLTESLHYLHDELQTERSLREKLENEVTDLTSQLNEKHSLLQDLDQQKAELVHFQQLVSDLEFENSRVSHLLLQSEEHLNDVFRESSSIASLETQLSEMHEIFVAADVSLIFTITQYGFSIQELFEQLCSINLQLEMCKLTITAITEEKETLMVSLQEKTEESARIELELHSLTESLHYLHDELQVERSLNEKFENEITVLTLQMKEKHSLLQDFDVQKTKMVQLKQLVSDLESEKSRVSHLLLHSEEHLKDVLRESSSITTLETQLSEMLENFMATDVSLTFTRTQYGACIEELVEKLCSMGMQLDVLGEKHLDVETELNGCLAREAHYIEDNPRLLTDLDSLRSDLEASAAKNRALIDQYSATREETKQYKNRTEILEATFCMHERQHALEVEKLEHLLASSYGEIEDLVFSREEAEIKCLILVAKLDELHVAMTSLKQYDDKLLMLQNQCSELTRKLSEQVLKTEEFKNLSIHLKELKEKADAELLNAREKRGPDGPPVVMQESLRIIFIKDQYETKLQELTDQLSVSKKHCDKMLWKFQDAIDEIENRKKSEASQIKRNKELGMKILELESELLSTVSERRELINAYDLMKAEKECSLISLECCKEEHQELEAALQKCNEEKFIIEIELNLTKELLECSSSHLNDGNDTLQKMGCTSDEPVITKLEGKNLISGTPGIGTEFEDMIPGNCPSVVPFSNSVNSKEEKSAGSVWSEGSPYSYVSMNMQPGKDDLLSRGANANQTHGHVTQGDPQSNDQKHMALTKSLKSSMDHLNKEFERMKNENLHLPVDDRNYEPNFPGLQRELMLLHEANEDLGNKFPLFNEISVSGNALERVLALEIELAEALQAQKKTSIHFQSSFLKQHSDEEAIFQSFRDINELIKDMLEIKARQAAVETELKDMHDRYSQLSLQFAEVEGERQKLVMTLKNIRSSKKALHPSALDHSP